MVDVEECGVGALEEDALVVSQELVEEVCGVGDVGAEAFCDGLERIEDGVGVVGRDVRVECVEGVVESAGVFESLAERVGAQEITGADGAGAVCLFGVGGSDAALGGADGASGVVLGEELFAERILRLVVGEDEVCAIREDESGGVDVLLIERVEFLDERKGIDDESVGDDGEDTGMEDAGGKEVECEAFSCELDGVPGIGAAVVSDDGVVVGREKVDDLALALVAPLEADNGVRVPRDGVCGAGCGGDVGQVGAWCGHVVWWGFRAVGVFQRGIERQGRRDCSRWKHGRERGSTVIAPVREVLAMEQSQTVRIMCPNLSCRSILAVPVSARGKLVRCKACGTNISVPAKSSPMPANVEKQDSGDGEQSKVA